MFTGIEVLDLADETASYSTSVLARMGARVIKIEAPGGSPVRRRSQSGTDRSHMPDSPSFLFNNANKLGITLDLSGGEGRTLFLKLVERADVLVETAPPGGPGERALDYGALSSVNPRLIHVSVTGFGRHGPRRTWKSCDLVASAFGGSMYVSGSPSTPPLKLWGEQSHFAASLFVVLGILLALRKRKKSGRGEHLDLSLQEAVTSTLENILGRFFQSGITTQRRGNRHGDDAFCVLPCRDGFIQITIFQQWDTLVGLMAGEGMAGDLEDEKWRDEEYRRSHVEHVIEIIGAWTKGHAAGELFQLGQLMGFPWALVSSPAEVLENEQLKTRGFFISPGFPGLPFRFGSLSPPPLKLAPSPGEDNVRIYRDELGLSDDELVRLAASGII